MRALKIFFLVLVLLAGFGLFGQYAEAQKTAVPRSGSGTHGSYHGGSHGSYHGSYHGGYHGGYHGYHGYRYGYYSPYFYRPYWGFYGYGWGYPYYGGYGYGYGYPAYSGYYYGYGEVKLDVKPKEAQVFLDGDYVGSVDDFNSWYQKMNVEPGKHRIVIRAQGYQPYSMDLRVLPGQSYKIKQQMHPGNDAIPQNDMRLPESEYRDQDQGRGQDQGRYQNQERDREYNRGYAQPDQEYQPEDRNQDQYNRNVEPYGSDGEQEGYQQNSAGKTMMTFQVEPRDATIYIDGNYYGTADAQNNSEIQVLLADGSHRVEVVRPGYASFSKDILVDNTGTHSITIQLEKK